jgi:hypothetical protein
MRSAGFSRKPRDERGRKQKYSYRSKNMISFQGILPRKNYRTLTNGQFQDERIRPRLRFL